MSRFASTISLFALTALTVWAVGATPSRAQDRTTSGRSRLELSLDHGYGFGSEGQYIELAADLRIVSPYGVGLVLRTGGALQGLSNGFAIDIGMVGRLDLFSRDHVGVQLAVAFGPSVAAGPFDGGNVLAYGGWALASLDLWYRNFFVGIGVSAHALLTERHGQEVDPSSLLGPRGGAPVLTLAPTIRVGGEWGL